MNDGVERTIDGVERTIDGVERTIDGAAWSRALPRARARRALRRAAQKIFRKGVDLRSAALQAPSR